MDPSQSITARTLEILVDYSNQPKGSPFYTEFYDSEVGVWWALSSIYSHTEKMVYWKLRLRDEPEPPWMTLTPTHMAIDLIANHARGEGEGYGDW